MSRIRKVLVLSIITILLASLIFVMVAVLSEGRKSKDKLVLEAVSLVESKKSSAEFIYKDAVIVSKGEEIYVVRAHFQRYELKDNGNVNIDHEYKFIVLEVESKNDFLWSYLPEDVSVKYTKLMWER